MTDRETAQALADALESGYAAVPVEAIIDILRRWPEAGEPVAHVVDDVDGGNRRVAYLSHKALHDTPVGTMLYASPPGAAQPEPNLQIYKDAIKRVRGLTERIAKLEAALRLAIRQNEHDILMTGEELRQCDAALSDAPAQPAEDDPLTNAELRASVAMQLREIERLRAENFALAAGQCVHATADDGGVLYCKEVLRLKDEMSKMQQHAQPDMGFPISPTQQPAGTVPGDAALNSLARMFHSGEEIEGDDGAAMMVDMALWNEGYEAFESILGDEAVIDAAAQPAGMALVPVEPTPEMIRAAQVEGERYGMMSHGGIYRAMIAAAPPSQSERVGLTPFGMTYKAHLQDALKWLDTRRERLHHAGCSVHAPSAQCNCGLHKTLTNVRAVINAMDEQALGIVEQEGKP